MVVLRRIFSPEEQQRFLIDEKYVYLNHESFFINDNSADYEDKIEEIIKVAEELEDHQFVVYRYLHDLSVELMVYGTKEALETLLDYTSLHSKVKVRKIDETRDINSINDLINKIRDAIYKDDSVRIHALADLLKEKLPESLDSLIVKAQAFEKEYAWHKSVLIWRKIIENFFEKRTLYNNLYPYDWEGTSIEEHQYAYAIAHMIYGYYKLDLPDGINYFKSTDDTINMYSNTLGHLYWALTDKKAFKNGDHCLDWLFKHFDGLENEINSTLGLD